MDKISFYIRRLYNASFIRFAAVGGIATGINFVTYLLLVEKFHVSNATFAYVMAFCVSIVFNFLLSSYFTFCVKPSWPRAGKFLTAHLINLANELILLNIWLWVGVSERYAPLCVYPIAFVINYFMVRFALRGKLLRRSCAESDVNNL